jgi:hypothetical protein
MRLARKFPFTVTCAILVVLAVNAGIDVQREIAFFDAETRLDSRSRKSRVLPWKRDPRLESSAPWWIRVWGCR